MVGRRLNDIELDSYDLLPADLARRVSVVRIPFIPGGYQGITLGRYVLLARDVAADGTSTLLAHELVHVRQWRDQGLLGFSYRYLRDFLSNLVRTRSWKRAYRDIPAELEASREATDWQRRSLRDRR